MNWIAAGDNVADFKQLYLIIFTCCYTCGHVNLVVLVVVSGIFKSIEVSIEGIFLCIKVASLKAIITNAMMGCYKSFVSRFWKSGHHQWIGLLTRHQEIDACTSLSF